MSEEVQAIGQVGQYTFQGLQLTLTMLKEGAKGMAHIIAFFRALAAQRRTHAGEVSLQNMLRRAQEENIPLVVATIPDGDKNAVPFGEFARNDYGLEFHAVDDFEHNSLDVLILQSDYSKFTAICDRLDISQDDIEVREFNVDVQERESVRGKLEYHASGGKDNVTEIHHKISEMDIGQIQEAVRGVKANEPEAMTPEKWQAYLEVQSTAWPLSKGNRDIVDQALPDNTIVMGESRWKELGLSLSDSAKPITINVPEMINGKFTGNYIEGDVYDIRDISGDVNMDSFFARANTRSMKAVADELKEKYPFVESDAAKQAVQLDPSTGNILYQPGLSHEQFIKEAQPEIVFKNCVKMQGLAAFDRNDPENVFRAASVQYAVCTKLGIDVSEVSFSCMEQMDSGVLAEVTQTVKKSVDRAISTPAMKNIEKTGKVREAAQHIR